MIFEIQALAVAGTCALGRWDEGTRTVSSGRPGDLGHKVSFGLAACWHLHSASDPKSPDLFISLLCEYPFPPGTGGGRREQQEFRMSAPSPPSASGATQLSPCPVALPAVSTLPGVLPGNKTSHLTVTSMASRLLRVRLSHFPAHSPHCIQSALFTMQTVAP